MVTRAAERDLNSAYEYIASALLNPRAADDLLTETEDTISGLSEYPERFSLADDPVLKGWGIRFVPVKNYLVFYAVSESDHTVYIISFLYGKRDWISVLKQISSSDVP